MSWAARPAARAVGSPGALPARGGAGGRPPASCAAGGGSGAAVGAVGRRSRGRLQAAISPCPVLLRALGAFVGPGASLGCVLPPCARKEEARKNASSPSSSLSILLQYLANSNAFTNVARRTPRNMPSRQFALRLPQSRCVADFIRIAISQCDRRPPLLRGAEAASGSSNILLVPPLGCRECWNSSDTAAATSEGVRKHASCCTMKDWTSLVSLAMVACSSPSPRRGSPRAPHRPVRRAVPAVECASAGRRLERAGGIVYGTRSRCRR